MHELVIWIVNTINTVEASGFVYNFNLHFQQE